MRSHFSHEIQFVKYRRVFFTISIVLILLAIVGVIVRGVNLGVEFKGGTQVAFENTGSIGIAQMRDAFDAAGQPDATIQTSDLNGSTGFLVSTAETDPLQANVIAAEVAESLGLSSTSYQVTTIGPNWGSNVTRSSIIAFVVVIALIILFVSIRYEFKMSLMAVVSLVHVMLIVIGIYAWFQIEVTPNVVAALLTIMGFCLYDTVVVFNRINENIRSLHDGIHRTALQITNLSENQIIVRSINTTLTSLMPVVAMLIFGGDTLKGFAFAMLVGLALGSYSSITIAAPLYALWKGREERWAKAEELYGESRSSSALSGVASVSEVVDATVAGSNGEAPTTQAAGSAGLKGAADDDATSRTSKAQKPAGKKGKYSGKVR